MPRQNKKAQKAKNQRSEGSGFHSVEHRVLSNSSDLEDPTYADHSSGEELDIQEDIIALQNAYPVSPHGPWHPYLQMRTAPGISKVVYF